MKNGSEFSEGVAVGAMISAVGFIAFLWLILHLEEPNINIAAEMFATMAALLGGWFALHGVRQQIQSNIELEKYRNEGRLAAARSVMPLALANITDVSRSNIRRHFHQSAIFDGSKIDEFRSLDDSILITLKECIEVAPATVAARISKIIASYQILHSRRTTVKNRKLEPNSGDWTATEHLTIDDVINWAVMHEMASSLFGFARGGGSVDIHSVSLQDVGSAFRNAGIMYENFEKLLQTLQKRQDDGKFEMDFERS